MIRGISDGKKNSNSIYILTFKAEYEESVYYKVIGICDQMCVVFLFTVLTFKAESEEGVYYKVIGICDQMCVVFVFTVLTFKAESE